MELPCMQEDCIHCNQIKECMANESTEDVDSTIHKARIELLKGIAFGAGICYLVIRFVL